MMLFCIGDFCLQQSYLIYPGPGVTCFGFFLRNPFSWFRLMPWGDIDELHAIKDITINLSWLTKKIVCQAELSRHSSSLERDELILFFAGCFCTLTNHPQEAKHQDHPIHLVCWNRFFRINQQWQYRPSAVQITVTVEIFRRNPQCLL